MARALITGPTIEPVTLTEAKLHLRVDGTEEDVLIGGLITAAREYAESFTDRALISQTWDVYYNQWPATGGFSLPLPPLQSVTSIKYTDDDNVEYTFAATNYVVDVTGAHGMIVLKDESAWPSADLKEIGGIRIRIVAGYGATTSAAPEMIRRAMLVLIGQMYENREGMNPAVADMMLWPYRVF